MTKPTRPDDKAPDTFFARQQAELDESGGRYAKRTPSSLTGQSPAPFPQLPASSPFAKSFDEIVGPEPPLATED